MSDAQLTEAGKQPGGWVYDIDPAVEGVAGRNVPPESIKGAWKIDENGRPTGYSANPNLRGN